MSDILEMTCRDDNATWRAGILPKHGGHCVFLSAESRGKVFHVFEPADLRRVCEKPTSYGCPILFPYANRVRGESFIWHGKRYTVPFARHGIVRTREWSVVEHQPSLVKLNLLLEPEEGTDHFPWHCLCEVTYQLRPSGLTVSFHVKNLGDSFPFTLGFHPYFFVNWLKPVNVFLPVGEAWALDEECFPSGKIRERYEDGFKTVLGRDSVYDDLYGGVKSYHVNTGNSHCHYHHRYRESEEQVGVCVSFSPGQFPFVCLYTPPDRGAICIEPYTGATDALNHLEDIRWRAKVLQRDSEVSYDIRIGLVSME